MSYDYYEQLAARIGPRFLEESENLATLHYYMSEHSNGVFDKVPDEMVKKGLDGLIAAIELINTIKFGTMAEYEADVERRHNTVPF
jgi:hypothetical protein